MSRKSLPHFLKTDYSKTSKRNILSPVWGPSDHEAFQREGNPLIQSTRIVTTESNRVPRPLVFSDREYSEAHTGSYFFLPQRQKQRHKQLAKVAPSGNGRSSSLPNPQPLTCLFSPRAAVLPLRNLTDVQKRSVPPLFFRGLTTEEKVTRASGLKKRTLSFYSSSTTSLT